MSGAVSDGFEADDFDRGGRARNCDPAGVARLETVCSEALVESIGVAEDEREELRAPVTRVFEAGLAVGLECGSGGGDGEAATHEP
jgi:hypothetical protein